MNESTTVASYIELLAGLPIPVSIASLKRSGEIYFVNDALTKAFGYTLSDLPDLDDFARHALPDRVAREQAMSWWTQTLIEAKHRGVPAQPREFSLIDRWGKLRQIIVHPTVIQGLVISAYQDRTEQRSTEKALQSAEQKLREEAYALTENIPVGTYTMVLEPGSDMAKFRFMSTRFLELTGLIREEAEADPLKGFACVHPEDYDEWVALNAQAFAKKEPFYGETRVVVDGEVRWISAESIPRELEDGTIVWEGVLMDLSRQKLAEESLQMAHQELLASTVRQSRLEEREVLLQDMHDGFGSQLVIARHSLEKGEWNKQSVADLLEQCLADLHLLADTLQLTESTLQQAMANFRHRIGQRLADAEVEILWDISLGDCPPFSSRKLVQIMRIVQEALSNALRHAKATTITIRAECQDRKSVLIEVLDDGVGLQANHSPGFGLTNMQKRADEVDGQLQITSMAPGTQVRLQLTSPAGRSA